MRELVETARAKINLSLRIHGRRPDGYHELESVVVFADAGDRLVVRPRQAASDAGRPSTPVALSVEGPFATSIVGDNLVATAFRLAAEAAGEALDAQVILEKQLPVAAGIGGGSADAAAALRAIRAAWPDLAERVDWMALARRLGADVPVCLLSRSALMTGIGERIVPLTIPALHAVLVNPRVPVPADKSRRVFAALAAPSLGALAEPAMPVLPDLAAVLDHVRSAGNDMERAATAVMPVVAEVKDAVERSSGCRHALISGAGPTVVGLCDSADAVRYVADHLVTGHPGWWVRATVLGGDG